MSNKPLNIGVVGAGYWGPNLIRNVSQSPNAVLHTVCDMDEHRLQKIKLDLKPLHITTDLNELLNNPEIDGVIVATPAETHHDIGMKVLAAGKHALIEKPLALSSQESHDLIAAAQDKNLILMVGHVFQYNASVLKLKEIIDSGEIGKVLYIYSTRVNLGKIRTDLNAFWNLAPHDISIINYLLDETPDRASGRGFNFLQPEQGVEDVVFAVLEYPNNTIAHIHTSWLDPNKIRRTTVVGEKKMVVYDDIGDNRITIYDKGAAWVEDTGNYGLHRLMTYTGDIHIPKIPAKEPLRSEIEHFFECITTGQTPVSDGHSGLGVVQVLEAVSKSIQQDGVSIEID